ncbi:TcdA/TcdB pore-forming domain-containing protein [Providencia rettgeri]|uniref:TcdA/TcdB pore-forming domain-containing protein n=2 Tax=Providencia TaxID=586 RepID=UPI00301B1A62
MLKLKDMDKSQFIEQAINDAKLKLGTVSGVRVKNRVASADIKSFKSHPSIFMMENAISVDSFIRTDVQTSKGDVQFVKVGSYSYELEIVINTAEKEPSMMIESYLLGYNGNDQKNKSPAFIDIPKHPSKAKFLFTHTLSGSSVIVTELNETTYRVYHDGRINSSILYDNVVMAVDYKDYSIKNTDETLGMVYMQYENGAWKLILQKQEYKIIGGVPIISLREDKIPLLVQNPLIKNQKENIRKFKLERDIKHQKLIEAAEFLGINTDAMSKIKEQSGDLSSDAAVIKSWIKFIRNIRKVVDVKLREKRIKIDNFKEQLSGMKPNLPRRRDEYDKIKKSIADIEKGSDYLKLKFNKLLSDSLIIESNDLWLKIKNSEGINSIIENRYDKSIGAGKDVDKITTIEQRFRNLLMEDSNRNNSFFFQGYNNYNKVIIPYSLEGLSSLELKKIYINNNLLMEQKGALSHYIEIEFEKEIIAIILKKSDDIKNFFYHSGSENIRLIPQDFYLLSVKDNSGGRCYPLVRAMAVALAKKGRIDSDHLIDKLFYAMSSPNDASSKQLKLGLIALHSNIFASQASSSNGVLNLIEIQQIFSESGETLMCSLNTINHAMLLGKTISEEKTVYYFYDPNFGIFEFSDEVKLFHALKEYMLKNKLDNIYNAMGNEKEPKFELITIDIEKMANVPIGAGLVVDDLHNPEQLSTISERREKVSLFAEHENRVTDDLQLQASLQLIDAKQWGERIDKAMKLIGAKYQLDNKWLINFSNIRNTSKDNYLIQFIHQEKEVESRWIETSDNTFLEFSNYFNQQIDELKNYHSLPKYGKERIDEEYSIEGLNMGIAVQALIQWADNKKRNTVLGVEDNLGVALKIHCYVNYAMIVDGNANDMFKIANIVKSLWRNEEIAYKNSMDTFTLSIARSENNGIGIMFNGVLVGLDIYELTQSDTEMQQAIFGTQLAFDSASLTLGLTSISAGAVGATGIAAFCSAGGVIVGGLAIGFNALAVNFAVIAEDAQEVGRYFYLLDKAYQGNGFDYITESKLLVARQGGVVEQVDFKNSQVVFGSQYIYRSGEHEAGGGYRNYFFWPSYANVINHEREKSLNIREEMGYTGKKHEIDFNKAKVIILPSTPKSYINYEHNMLPGATSRNDRGFDILRRLEKSQKFDFDYYTFPSEYIISKIQQEYVKTNIDIILDRAERYVAIPELPKEWYGLLNYEMQGGGGIYNIILNDGAEITLSNQDGNDNNSNWIINSSLLSNDSISFYSGKIKIGDAVVNFSPSYPINSLVIIRKNNEICSLDLKNRRLDIISEDASQWMKNQGSVKAHLSQLARENKLYEKYITIENYQHNGVDIGRAFYDVEKDNIFYIESGYASGKIAVLSVVEDGLAYIIIPNESVVFIIDINLNKTLIMYRFDDGLKEVKKNVKVWKVNNGIYMSCISKENGNETKSVYQYINNTLYLISYSTDDFIPDFFYFNGSNREKDKYVESGIIQVSPKKMMLSYESYGGKLESDNVKLADTIMIYGKMKNGKKIRFWLREKDCKLIRANIKESITYEMVNVESPEMNNNNSGHRGVYEDLIYVGSQYNNEGEEVFYFYNSNSHLIYWQKGLLSNIMDENGPIAERVEIEDVINMINWEGRCIAITDEGGVYRISSNGNPTIIAVNEQWLKKYNNWFNKLTSRFGNNSIISILGLTDKKNGHSLYAWYADEGLFISTEFYSTKEIVFLGYDKSTESIFIFDKGNGKLYLHKKIDASIVNQAFSHDGVLNSPELINKPNDLYPDFKIKNAEISGGNLILKTEGDNVIVHAINDSAIGNCIDKKSAVLIKSGSNNDDFLTVDDNNKVKKIIFNGKDGHDTYIVSESMWKENEVIIIDNNATDLKVDNLIWLLTDFDEVVINRNRDDLVFTDMKYQTKLILREVFGSRAKQYQHLSIALPSKVENIEIEKLIMRYQDYGPFMPLSAYYDDENVTASTLVGSMSLIGADKDTMLASGFKKTELLSNINNMFSSEMTIY